MSAQEQTCYTLICDECREHVYEAEEGSEYHFESAESLRSDATKYGGWSRDSERDLCPSCTCAHAVHRPRIAASGFVYCDRCDETLLDSITAAPNARYL